MLRITLLVALCASALGDDLSHHSHWHSPPTPTYQPAQHVQYATPQRPKGPPPGGYAAPDALEVATKNFFHEYKKAAAAAAAAPDIDIHTTKDGLPLGPHQGASAQYPHTSSHAPAPAAPSAPVAYTPEVAATRDQFLQLHAAEAARPGAGAQAVAAAQPTVHVSSSQSTYHPRGYYHSDDDEDRHAAPAARPQPPARLLVDAHGTVVGVDETDEVKAARQQFQAQYDRVASLIASHQAAAAPVAYSRDDSHSAPTPWTPWQASHQEPTRWTPWQASHQAPASHQEPTRWTPWQASHQAPSTWTPWDDSHDS